MSVSLVVLMASIYKICTGWLARAMYGGPLHKTGARLLYLPSLARMSFLWSYLKRRNWYDRIDDTVILGALPFKSQTKEVHRHYHHNTNLPPYLYSWLKERM